MKNVCVITGGGSGMGLAAAKNMPKEKIIVISGRTVSKLENAVNELKELGYEAYAFACDTSDRESVKKLAEYAASLGEIKNVINAAGVSPAMCKACDQEKILRINALGTVYVNQEFSKKMNAGSVICDISSNSPYALPSFILPKKAYPLAETDEAAFLAKLIKLGAAQAEMGAYILSGDACLQMRMNIVIQLLYEFRQFGGYPPVGDHIAGDGLQHGGSSLQLFGGFNGDTVY